MNRPPKPSLFLSCIFALTLTLSSSSLILWQAVAEAKTVTLTMNFFGTRRKLIGQGQFSYDDAQPYRNIQGVDYFRISDFEATFGSQKWSLDDLVSGSQPLLWAPEGESYPTPRIATIGGFGALTQGWAFYKSRTVDSENYGVLLIKNPAYRNQGDFALTIGVQDVRQGGVFEIQESPPNVSLGLDSQPRLSELWKLGLVGVGIF
ncbi:hypothetical protein PJF56_18055 [Roseofilum sp. BLCC_M91]|uniref:Uncharacterized protein n=1 Tax=Roseofilum halophilum BLCC-M91 TaxID=3022259 RepID=A0ABT7BNK2_9CYAN|nr:hypothetical protein [Roseofilum halophilum]MDJ1180766.1 hypothetical protein [Roseofilum halophilum BLCC-M91]